MNYFLVFQNKTYDEERKGRYLWAPQKTATNKIVFHWENMKAVKKDDIIFSLKNRKIVAISVAKQRAIDHDRPLALDNVNLWEKLGWLLDVEYKDLENPIDIDSNDNINKILEYSPTKYAPFNKTGRGNQGYLFEIGVKLGEFLLELVQSKNSINPLNISKEDIEYIENIDKYVEKIKDETEKYSVIKSRIGQGIFKNKLLMKSCKCNICGLSIKSLLIASHCKPWEKANNQERLDENNGLLLCPTHDALFDKGLIIFEDNGNIKISNLIKKSEYMLLNINNNIKLNFSNGQIKYIQWHREKVFKID